MKKLTLNADPKIIAQAKRLAARRRTSVSAMFASFVVTMTGKEETPIEVPSDSIAARVTGAISLPKGRSERDVLTEALLEKYGIKP